MNKSYYNKMAQKHRGTHAQPWGEHANIHANSSPSYYQARDPAH